MSFIVKIENASVRRDGKYILDNVSIKVEEMGHLAII